MTRYAPLIPSIDNDREVCACIDGAHAAHMDGKGHSGMCLIIGRGPIMNVSKKLGLVTTIYTETEVVTHGKRFHKCSWFRYFRLAQVDEAKEDMLMQYNESCALLHKNFYFSFAKGSKHVHVR